MSGAALFLRFVAGCSGGPDVPIMPDPAPIVAPAPAEAPVESDRVLAHRVAKCIVDKTSSSAIDGEFSFEDPEDKISVSLTVSPGNTDVGSRVEEMNTMLWDSHNFLDLKSSDGRNNFDGIADSAGNQGEWEIVTAQLQSEYRKALEKLDKACAGR